MVFHIASSEASCSWTEFLDLEVFAFDELDSEGVFCIAQLNEDLLSNYFEGMVLDRRRDPNGNLTRTV
jgi:hypothetical protein